MPVFRIYEESDNDGMFVCGPHIEATDAREALNDFVANHTHYVPPGHGSRFIVNSVDGDVTYLFKLAAPPQTWEVVSA